MMSIAELVVKGAWYCAEQAGHVVDSAVLLIDAGHAAIAQQLAMQAIESVGKAIGLLDARKEMIGGEDQRWLDSVLETLTDHELLQRKGMTAASISFDSPSQGIGRLVAGRTQHPPRSTIGRELRAQLADAIHRSGKRLPSHRHNLRVRAQYVDLLDGRWNRPSVDISLDDARLQVDDAVATYSWIRDFLQPEILDPDDPWTSELLAWDKRPPLPEYRWPVPPP